MASEVLVSGGVTSIDLGSDGVAAVTAAAAQRPLGVLDSRRPGNRILVESLFWVGLVASAGLWWLNTPAQAVTDWSSAIVAAGRITGLVSGFVLLVEVLTVSRVPWIEAWLGGQYLSIWHRSLAIALVVLVPVHIALLGAGRSVKDVQPLSGQSWSMLSSMTGAAAGAFVVLLVGLLTAWRIRAGRRSSQLLRRVVDVGLCLAPVLVVSHQFALGSDLIRPGLARRFWITLYLCVAAAVVWGRVVRPGWLNVRHRFRVIDIVDESQDWISIFIGGRRLDRLRVAAGQHVDCRFLTRESWWNTRALSISAAPNGRWLRLTVKVDTPEARDLLALGPRARVWLTVPRGTVTAGCRTTDKALLIVSDRGIAPAIGLLEELPPGSVLLYRAESERGLVLRDEIEASATERGTRGYFVLGSADDYWPKRAFTVAGLRELVPDVGHRDVYVCGPKRLVDECVEVLRQLEVPECQVHRDPFGC